MLTLVAFFVLYMGELRFRDVVPQIARTNRTLNTLESIILCVNHPARPGCSRLFVILSVLSRCVMVPGTESY